ncbi:MAG: hypothetical protein L0Y75_02005, partial [Acidobacteria bacterium]|nr:hypothetical protein [Acidobacteriota bacterium]
RHKAWARQPRINVDQNYLVDSSRNLPTFLRRRFFCPHFSASKSWQKNGGRKILNRAGGFFLKSSTSP